MAGIPDLTMVEYACAASVPVMTGLFLFLRRERLQAVFLSIMAIVPAALLTAEGATQFLTCDDSYLFYDIVNFYGGAQPNWELGAFRTTITVFGPLFALVRHLSGATADIILVAVKAGHWLLGIFLILLIVDQLHRWYALQAPRSLFYVIAFTGVALLPVVTLALKTLNYDMLSMELGVLAMIWLGAGFVSSSSLLLIASIVAATLAAHEKLIASPVLWLCVIAGTVRLVWQWRAAAWHMFTLRTICMAAVTLGISIAILLCSFGLVIATHGPNPPEFSVYKVFSSYLMLSWPVIRLFIGEQAAAAVYFSLQEIGPGWFVPVGAAFVSVVAALSCISCRVLPVCFRLLRRFSLLHTMFLVIAQAKSWLLLLCAITGGVATYVLRAQVWPLVSTDKGDYIPTATFNGISLCFGAGSFLGHSVASVAWACAVFSNAFPTIVLVALIVAAFVRANNDCCREKVIVLVTRDLIAMLFFAGVLLYGVLQIPLLPRYLNLFFLGALVFCLPDLFVGRIVLARRAVLPVAIGIVLLIAEIVPFGPAYVSFHPIWVRYSHEFGTTPAFAKEPPWATGWGEEICAASKKIYSLAAGQYAPCDTIRIFHNYPGSWIRPPKGVTLTFMDHQFKEYSYGACDYYVFTRTGVTHSIHPFPYGIAPLFTLDHRGFVTSWVYNAADLLSSGFRFEPGRRQRVHEHRQACRRAQEGCVK